LTGVAVCLALAGTFLLAGCEQRGTTTPATTALGESPKATMPFAPEEASATGAGDAATGTDEAMTAAPSPRLISTPMPAAPSPSPEIGLMTSDPLTTDQLKQFDGQPGVARLKWTTQSEKNNFGFWVMRKKTEDGEFVPINSKIVMGAGNSSTPNHYVYYDLDVKVGEMFFYRIDSISLSGDIESFSPVIPFKVNRLYKGGLPPAGYNAPAAESQDKTTTETASDAPTAANLAREERFKKQEELIRDKLDERRARVAAEKAE
jgi:hypothetical protein